jgi:uncharacterized cupin superfamily protein
VPDFNIYTSPLEPDESEPPGYRAPYASISRALGAQEMAANVILLGPGESICPYHYEYDEEWLIVLTGEVTVRTPKGEETAVAGDVVLFPAGPDGAHKVTGREGEPARVIMISPKRYPGVAVYPDSDKIGVFPGNDADRAMFHRKDGNVDYWEGEA